MKPTARGAPAEYVRASLPDERRERMWRGVVRAEARLAWRRKRSRGLVAGAMIACAAAAALVIRRPAPGPATGAGTLVDAATERYVTLPDSSSLSIAPASRIQLVAASSNDARVRLEHGSVACDIPPRPGHRFVVEAAGYDVEVRGTKFTVTVGAPLDHPAVAVRVERGSVAVRERGGSVLAVLQPGQSWASDGATQPPAAPTSAVPCSSCAEPALPSADPAPCASCDVAVPIEDAPCPSCALAPVGPPAGAPPVNARSLFEQADAARLGGRAAEAAAAFDQLRRRFPHDARAGYAAFQLGRIRLDTLRDARGAAEAFSFALAHPGVGFFRDDAEVRLVEALGRAHDGPGCRRARDAFLARHAVSAQVARMAKQCDGL